MVLEKLIKEGNNIYITNYDEVKAFNGLNWHHHRPSKLHTVIIIIFSRLLGSLMQADEDLEDLEQALGKKEVRHVFGSGSCSALIKLLPGNKDLYISQVTWNSYSSLLRVFKLIDVPFTVSGTEGAWWIVKVNYFF